MIYIKYANSPESILIGALSIQGMVVTQSPFPVPSLKFFAFSHTQHDSSPSVVIHIVPLIKHARYLFYVAISSARFLDDREL